MPDLDHITPPSKRAGYRRPPLVRSTCPVLPDSLVPCPRARATRGELDAAARVRDRRRHFPAETASGSSLRPLTRGRCKLTAHLLSPRVPRHTVIDALH